MEVEPAGNMDNKHIKIADKIIGPGEPVFIIAEAGVNHNGDIELAKKLIEKAKESGADAVKFQTFKTENIIIRDAPKSTYHIETTGDKESWFALLKTQELDRSAHEILIKHCEEIGIIFLSTPYDEESANLLEELDVPAFKVASTDSNNIPFLKHLARKKRPIILSTGMCTLDEVRESVDAIVGEGCNDLILLHCTANYPADLKDTNLRAMLTLKKEFDLLVGYSDHTIGHINPIAATALGAVVYEKHFTLDKNLPGPDHRSSLNPNEFKQLVKDIRDTELAMGSSKKEPAESEKENRQKLRKSIVAKMGIPAGVYITSEMLAIKRPGTGLAPKLFDYVVGKKAKTLIKKDTLLKNEDFE